MRAGLIATLGPASMELAAELVAAGASGLRLNASHIAPDALGASVEELHRTLPGVPITVDLQGAKMRLGHFPPRELRRGELLDLAPEPSAAEQVPLPHPELFRAVAPGEVLSCDDGRVELVIRECGAERIVAESLSAGCLQPRKGVNRLEHPVDPDDLGMADRAHLRIAAARAPVRFACSFMRDGREAAWIRCRAPGRAIVGKVERREALDNLEAIASACDELWICRGDLGAQLGLAAMGRAVARLRPLELDRPVWMAGQVLEHLTHHAQPTRSEVCHLLDLLSRGYAGIVLSDETAIGVDPLNAVRCAAGLMREFRSYF